MKQNMLQKVAFGGTLLALACSAAAVGLSDVGVLSHQPWCGKYDLSVNVSGIPSGEEYALSFALVEPDGTEHPITMFETEPVVSGNGTHKFVWDAAAELPGRRIVGAKVRASCDRFDGSQDIYLVFDLSGGKDATSYPHRYTTQGPDLANDVCRTTELWLRRVPSGSFMRGNPACVDGKSVSTGYLPYHQVNLTKAYYLGVFELTQQQYYLMEGTWPSYFSYEPDRATRPVEKVSLTGFRGANSQNGWYDDSALSAGPLSRLRAKCGFDTLDLPSEAQWERAARAGVEGATYPWGNDVDSSRERNSQTPGVTTSVTESTPAAEGGTEKVGMHEPNPWGFYDMGGNVSELSTSGYAYNGKNGMVVADYAGAPYTDPLGPTPEWSERNGGADYTSAVGATVLSGSWGDYMTSMNVYRRLAIARSISSGSSNTVGIRLCITCK